jgi:hypothetical protein
MGTNSQSGSESSDTNTRIDAHSPDTNLLSNTTTTVTSPRAGSTHEHHKQSCFFSPESDRTCETLDRFVSDVITIAQSRCERATDYDDIEPSVCHLRLNISYSPRTIR